MFISRINLGFWYTTRPPFPRVGVRVRLRVRGNPNPMEGWVNYSPTPPLLGLGLGLELGLFSICKPKDELIKYGDEKSSLINGTFSLGNSN